MEGAIEMTFGISQQVLEEIIDKSLVDDNVCGYDPAVFFAEMLRISSVFRLMADKYSALDASILSLTLQGVEDAIIKNELKITANKKAGAVVMLYRAFKASGQGYRIKNRLQTRSCIVAL